MTALTLSLITGASTTNSTANSMLENASAGGSLSNKNTNLTSGTTGWIIVYGAGNGTAQTGSGSQPALQDLGWIDDASTLQGNHLNAGTWSFSIPLETTVSGSFVADIHFQFYLRASGGGTRTLIAEAIATSQTIISTSFTTITGSVSGLASSTFATGDRLGVFVTANITTNATTGNLRVDMSSSGTLGNTTAQIVTPGYSSVTTSTRTTPLSAALQSTLNRTTPLAAALLSTNVRTVPLAAALLSTNVRTTPLSTALLATLNRVTPLAASLTSGSIRTTPLSAALLATLKRNTPLVAALQSTLVRTTPLVAAITNTFTRSTPLSTALQSTLTRNVPMVSALLATINRVTPLSTALLATINRNVPLSASLFQAANFFATTNVETLGGLNNSDLLVIPSGGVETSITVTAPASGTGQYIELLSQGGIATGTYAIPSPTGFGWSIPLQGKTILYGAWNAIMTLKKSGTAISGNGQLIVRFSRRTYDGAMYTIATTTLSAQTFNTVKTAYTTNPATSTVWNFVGNDVLYMDVFIYNPGTWASDVFTVYVSSSATQGVINDGQIIAPEMITSAPGVTMLIGATNFVTGGSLPVKNESFVLDDALDQRSQIRAVLEDVPGTTQYTPNMPMIVSDSTKGRIFSGYLASDTKTKVSASSSVLQREHLIVGVDHHRDYDKEANGVFGSNVNGTNYLNWTAGDIFCDFIARVQTNNGIWGEFAIDSDYTQADFATGTLTNTTATSTSSPFTYAPNVASPPTTTNTGDLELTRAGTQFTLVEDLTADFASGTLTNMTAANNQLVPNTQSAMKITVDYSPVTTSQSVPATESGGVQTDDEIIVNYVRSQFWTGTQTVGTLDTLNYDIWISSTSPAFLAGIGFVCSDGTRLLDFNGTLDANNSVGLFDQNSVSVDVLSDLSAYAKDCWYTRSIPLTSAFNGKSIIGVYVFHAGSSNGTYTTFIKNCYLTSASGSPFFSTSATVPQTNPPTITGYGGYLFNTINTSVVQVYNPLVSSRVSPSHSISGVGLVQNSTITWAASLPTTGATGAIYPSGTIGTTANPSITPAMVMMVSYDNATWLLCQNGQALPGLPPGANVSGLSLYLREQFAAGVDPSAIPALLQVNITINSAAAQTVSDIVTTYGTSTEWNTGAQVLTGPNSNGNLILGSSSNPLTQNWSNSSILNNQTFLAGSNNAGTQAISGGAYTMTTWANPSAGAWCQSRFDWAGYFQNGTIEADLKVSSSNAQCGFEYRQTGWGNANNNGAYYVCIQNVSGNSGVFFGYGQNDASNTSGTFTNIQGITETINSGTFYHIKVVVVGNRHTIYFNGSGTPIIDVLDNQYPTAGQIGFRAFAISTSAITATIDNFSIVTTTSGTWTSPTTSLTSLGTCGYSQVCWTDLDSTGKIENTTLVLASIDGGTTFQVCTNGAEISQLPRGTSTSGASLVIQMILSSVTPPVSTPLIMGLYVRVCGNYGTVTGTRVTNPLSLSQVGYVASSNALYNANIPTGTTFAMATSIDNGASYQTVGNSGAGYTLSYWTNQVAPTTDNFSTNTLANYTNTAKSGGSAASVSYNIATDLLTLQGGSGGLYLVTALTGIADVDISAVTSYSDNGGIVFREASTSSYYEAGVYDASSNNGTYANAINLYKVSGGTRTLLGTNPIMFARFTFHSIRVTMKNNVICVFFDGQCVQAYLDASPIASGGVGLRNDGGISLYYDLYIQPLGTNLSGRSLIVKETMTTTDPSQMPQLFSAAVCVRGPSIATGATIAQLHPVTQPFAAFYSSEADALVTASGDFFWYIDEYFKFIFRPRQARQGAFPVHSAVDTLSLSGYPAYSGYLLYNAPMGTSQVSVTNSANQLRNREIVINVSQLITPPTVNIISDGNTISWTLGYPLYSAPIILVNGQPATIGVQGIDNNKQFYWQPNSPTINYDPSLPKLADGTIAAVTYTGESPVNQLVDNLSAQSIQGALELNSGVIVDIQSAISYNTDGAITVNGMTTTQATNFGNGLLTRFGNMSPNELKGTTPYSGLRPGTVIPVFIPELDLWNTPLPIVKITTTAFMGPNGMIYLYSIDATDGANVSQWTRTWYG